MRRFLKSNGNLRTIVVAAVVATVCGGSAAVAGTLVTSQDIQDGTIKPVDINKKLRKKIYRKSGTLAAAVPGQAGTNGTNGTNGSNGSNGSNGANGSDGAAGTDAEYEAGNWGVMARNTIGSPVAELRAGPFGTFGVTGPQAAPPFGEGSLGIAVADNSMSDPPGTGVEPQEKVAFGNEVDFFGDALAELDEAGFHAFQTGENANIGAANLPNITLEIDSNLTNPGAGSPDYSSLVFVPVAQSFTGGGSWTGYIDATDASEGSWYLTGGEGTVTGCNATTLCSFDALMLALDDDAGASNATIHTVAVGKGRDKSWVGAVDGLRLGDTIYDFEPLGVEEIPAP